MSRVGLLIAYVMTLCLASGASPAEGRALLLSDCTTLERWSLSLGGEFPGAEGDLRLTEEDDREYLTLDYDFAGGGKYTAALFEGPFPPELVRLQVDVIPAQACRVNCRMVGAGGRTFLSYGQEVEAGKLQTLTVERAGPWSNSWGGEERESPLEPVSQFHLMAENAQDLPSKGSVRVAAVRALTTASEQALEPAIELPNIEVRVGGWHVVGEWNGEWPHVALRGKAIRVDGGDGVLSMRFPMMARDYVERVVLMAEEEAVPFSFLRPLREEGNNPRNVYRVEIRVEGESATGARVIPFRGRASHAVNLGAPKHSNDIEHSIVGTCAHFGYSRSRAFGGWSEIDLILDLMAEAGIKWVRDNARALERADDGSLRVQEWELAWLRKAKERGVNVIFEVPMKATEPLEDWLARLAVVVEETDGLVAAYELGNEPNNFGGWVEEYGGTWNGKEADNTTSPWVVAHLEYTNAGAERVKALKPNATVIGLGATACTNFRYLDLGVTEALDGVVEHPYTYSMPPERVPFGVQLEERDGVRVGDEEASFEGLIRSYAEKFEQMGRERTLWLTEFGFSAFWFDGEREDGIYAGFTERAQAVYLVRRFLQTMALPVAAACQYDFLDDYGSPQHNPEGNFGLVRADYTPKPAYYAVQRMTSLLAGYAFDPALRVVVERDRLHQSMMRRELGKNWEEIPIRAACGVFAYGFRSTSLPEQPQIAVWSGLPAGNEFNNRCAALRIPNMAAYDATAVAVELVSGDSFDVPVKADGDDLVVEQLVLTEEPLLLKLFRRD